jgi:hypothetical protein
MPRIYAIEALMYEGQVVTVGEAIDASPDDVAAILSSGRGTQDKDIAIAAAKAAKQAAAIAANAASIPAVGTVEFNAAVAAAVSASLAQIAQPPAPGK